jgi:hypothetical protein
MCQRMVVITALAGAFILNGLPAKAREHFSNRATRPCPPQERLAQGSREDGRSDSVMPGGLPGRSEQTDDTRPNVQRSVKPREAPRAKAAKEKEKAPPDREKKNQ